MNCLLNILTAAAVAVAVFSSPAIAAVYLIEPDGTGDFPTIQDAIAAATGGDVIELSDGTFTGDGNRDIDFLGKAITLRSRSGNPKACIIDCEAGPGYEHRGFYFQSGEGPESVLEGITLTGAFRSENAAGVYCWEASPTFADCIFTNNTTWYSGGAIYARECFSTFTRCRFLDNTAYDAGGAVFLHESAPLLTECTFRGNESVRYYGGGISCSQSSPSLTDCVFDQNLADMGGGAIWCYPSGSPQLTRCAFTGNSAHLGGAVQCFSSSPVLTRCTFASNTAFQGAGIWCYESSALLTECLLAGNSAVWGGGMYCGNGSPSLRHCTLCGNSAPDGGGIWCDLGSSPEIVNTLIVFSTEGEGIGCDESVTGLSLTCSDIYGNAGGDWAGCPSNQPGSTGNFSEDPLFCDSDGECFQLQECSPCIDGYGCGQVGAFGVGCPCGGGASGVDAITWTRMKDRFKGTD
ncbi:MAG: right-handed parallel beta-helix repeat-containing protein [Candidatus Eisenbacteria sp.]|nr:right-handed parallel beta-helix repeat-containing protein [Candidatus Eisenbacteria bacterium]